jgi:hypothetical protein
MNYCTSLLSLCSTTGTGRYNGDNRDGFGDLGGSNNDVGKESLSGEFLTVFDEKQDKEDGCDA